MGLENRLFEVADCVLDEADAPSFRVEVVAEVSSFRVFVVAGEEPCVDNEFLMLRRTESTTWVFADLKKVVFKGR